MTGTAATRSVSGVDLPGPGRWTIDPGHAEVAFIGRHLVFTKIRGRFRDVDGFIEVDEDPNKSTVEVNIAMASVDSGDQARDDHLRSPDLFDVERYPTATFRGTASKWNGHTGQLVGDLTIKEITRPVTLDVEYLGFVVDPWGGERAIFSAAGTINRDDWDVGWNLVLETGGVLVSKEIRIELELETIRQT